MKAVIADDEALARSLLRALLEDAEVEVLGEAENGRQAVALVDRLRPDVVFLDIDMPGGSGIGAAHDLQSRSSTEVVFVTAHERHACDAFELGAADYVLKPVRRPRLAKAIDRVRARLSERGAAERDWVEKDSADHAFWVRTYAGKVRLAIADIVWIEAARDHVYFHTGGGSYLHRITMDELEDKLKGTGLVRVQRSAFVRLDKVTGIVRRGKTALLELGSSARVTVGPSYQAKTLTTLAALENRPRG